MAALVLGASGREAPHVGLCLMDTQNDTLPGLSLPRNPRLPLELVHYTVAEVADALRCSHSTVYRYQDRGLEIDNLFGLTLIRHDELVRFLRQNLIPLRRGGGRRRPGRAAH